MKHMNTQRGFGLVELMISITLGLFLSAAIIQVFLGTSSSARVQDAQAQVQENARFAMRFLGQEIRMAGYAGCSSLGNIPINNIALPASEVDFSTATSVVGANDVDKNNSLSAVVGTDTLEIKRGSDEFMRITGNLAPNNANVQIEDNSIGLVKGDYVLITDCLNADIFRIVNNPKGPGEGKATFTHSKGQVNSDNRLSKVYGADAEILAFETIRFFVRDSGRDTSAGDAINSLYVERRGVGAAGAMSSAIELVEGVEDLQLTYGVDTDDDRSVDVYRGADDVTDWEDALSVRVELVLVSNDTNVVGRENTAWEQNTVDSAGNVIANQDGRFRQVFTSVFAIRNKLP